MLDDHLLNSKVLNMPAHSDIGNICKYCRKSESIGDQFCIQNATSEMCEFLFILESCEKVIIIVLK